jgi:hypothetical protein
MPHFRNRDSLVSIATGYGLDGPGSIPDIARFLFSPHCPERLRPTQPIQWVPGTISLGVKRPAIEADHSSPSSAEVENGGDIPPLPDISSWHSA